MGRLRAASICGVAQPGSTRRSSCRTCKLGASWWSQLVAIEASRVVCCPLQPKLGFGFTPKLTSQDSCCGDKGLQEAELNSNVVFNFISCGSGVGQYSKNLSQQLHASLSFPVSPACHCSSPFVAQGTVIQVHTTDLTRRLRCQHAMLLRAARRCHRLAAPSHSVLHQPVVDHAGHPDANKPCTVVQCTEQRSNAAQHTDRRKQPRQTRRDAQCYCCQGAQVPAPLQTSPEEAAAAVSAFNYKRCLHALPTSSQLTLSFLNTAVTTITSRPTHLVPVCPCG